MDTSCFIDISNQLANKCIRLFCQEITFLLVSHFCLTQRLCDNDPGVMGATLCPLFDLVTGDVSSFKDLVVSFVSILKQVAERRLPKSYDYHQIPAPFIQVCDMLVRNITYKLSRNSTK